MVLEGIGAQLGFGPINVANIVDKLYFYIGIFFIFLVIGLFIGIIWKVRSKDKQTKLIKKIGWWEEGNMTMHPSSMDDAEEIIIPGTTLRVFYVAKRDLWLPRFTRGVTKDLFYVLLTQNRQMLNFTLKVPAADGESRLDFDNTDMLWAAENTREFIKRNYKDKSVKWWQEYKEVIAVASLILVMTFGFVIIIYFLKGMVNDIGSVASTLGQILKETEAARQTSGVVPA